MVVQDVVEDGHCECTEEFETGQDSRTIIMNIGTGQDP